MPPLPWGTPEQIEFLSAKVPEFQASQRTKTTPNFWTKIYQEFFVLWPTPEAEVRPMTVPKKKKKKKNAPVVLPQTKTELSHAEWVKLRKNQIVNWFNNRGAGTQHRRGPTIVIGGNNAPRLLSETNLYSKKYYDERIRPRVIEALRTNPEGHRIAIINKCTGEAWNDESDEVKAEIRAELAKLKELKGQIPDMPEVMSPEECAINLLTLPETIQAFIDEMSSRTGWVFTVIAGGPEPADQGKIRTVAVHNAQEDRDRQTLNSSKAKPEENQVASTSKVETGDAGQENVLSETTPPVTTQPEIQSNALPIAVNQVPDPAALVPTSSTHAHMGSVAQLSGLPIAINQVPFHPTYTAASVPISSTNAHMGSAAQLSGPIPNTITAAHTPPEAAQQTAMASMTAAPAVAIGFAQAPVMTQSTVQPAQVQPTQSVASPSPPCYPATNGATHATIEAQNFLPPANPLPQQAKVAPNPVAAFLPYGAAISMTDGVGGQDIDQLTAAVGQDMMRLQAGDANRGDGLTLNFSEEEWDRIDLALQQYAADPNMMGTALALNTNNTVTLPGLHGQMLQSQDMMAGQANAPMLLDPNHSISAPHTIVPAQTSAPVLSATNSAGVLSNHAVNDPIIPESGMHAPLTAAPDKSENLDASATRSRNRKAAASKDAPQTTAWLLAASEYLFKDIEVEKWQECVRAWESFERMEIAEMDTSSLRLPAKGRPTALGKWLSSSRKYTAIPAIRQDEFQKSWMTWWNSIQPAWRQTKTPNSLPLSFETAKAKDSMASLRKGGPNGLLTVMVGLKWWYSAQASDGLWELAVSDLLNTFNTFQKAKLNNKRKAAEETGKEKRTKKAKA
ncbi:hypothetical protein JR316_0004534 [Psilocybe cubensis]|uniref:Uncharacterized protein n=6 Tax=Psilocybe cubensis TaxID=181762 RepID=A0A8H7Y007_PSICU|nr:hypothetical protein JR316_0011696 [Psilocybe cubensis]XP_047744960.1 hypothetical protein JR316_0009540 [Psilocybe cubensis]XP_047746530.1 hypothetical protein JR316_0009367 [Psilocybe cubensis]XP_047747589.1 hypothetical protein JR316_0008561 [Psilocybe cubensis]XP_047750059.1 hypothetical protein JR316_0004534 [Psilocybe cubensis]KAH9476125.1 hypothetical protein JR316_0011696 [Psilocybe cubensis]KAH9477335.1 hypothetical protein JR316_0009540 [Psilocybe cubensis]KAH9478905.1 hypotheti